jgi:ABC-type transporter lipoprotein component MlaA/pimeloyl-ACP methyl ester carboxylesterase
MAGIKVKHLTAGRIALATVLAWGVLSSAPAQSSPAETGEQFFLLPKSVPDPLEPANRFIYGLNKSFLIGAVQPTAKVYRFIVRKPLRTGIGNFGRNITYPGRLINTLLEGEWVGARDETYRFGCNTFLGLGGFFDLASKWKIPKKDADFGQTFDKWGWNAQCYLMLPLFGPSNERDLVGLGADTAANPLTYIAPYSTRTPAILKYFSPYTYISYGILYNNLSDSVDNFARFSQSEQDAYATVQYAWTFARKSWAADFAVQGEQDEASLETLGSVFFKARNQEFPNRGTTLSASIPATHRKLRFTYWMQPTNAPIVYIAPGLGSHRLAEPVLALAELVYKQGFSVVSVSSTFNHEFIEQAASAEVPAYMSVDVKDLHVALTEIDHRLEKRYPKRLGARALMGYSMGGFQTLFLAGAGTTNAAPLLKFDRYVAIDAPVRLLHGIAKLDEYFQAPLAWPATERDAGMENTLLKVAAISKNLDQNQPQVSKPQRALPFSGIESKFLVGLTFRFILRDAIYSSQQKHNQGVLRHSIRKTRRAPLYQEILQYSYHDYLEKFLIPYYWGHGVDLTLESLAQAGDLRAYAAGLHGREDVRLIVNQNDFLLSEDDLQWLRATFSPEHLTVFEKGGHLGNLGHPEVQKAILAALDGLGAIPKPPAHGQKSAFDENLR